MPKIDAPTVAEHHRQRRAALLAAATSLLAEHGLDAVTLAAVGACAGLARSSVYQYFDSTPALIAAVVEDVMPRAAERVAAAMSSADSPMAKVDAFVAATLDAATAPVHRSLRALEGAGIPAACLARVDELHSDLEVPERFGLRFGSVRVRPRCDQGQARRECDDEAWQMVRMFQHDPLKTQRGARA